MPAKVEPKQQRFIEEYLKDLNATQAAIRAGYSPKTAQEQGSRLLAKKAVRAAVQAQMDARSERTEVTQDMVLNELRRIAFGKLGDVATWNASGVAFKDSSSLDEDTLATVSEASETTNQHGGSLKIKQHDKVKALELLGRHLGMFNDKLQIVGGERPLKDLSDSELMKLRGNGK